MIARRLSRRGFLLGMFSAGTVAASGAAYSRFGEPHWLETSVIKVPLRSASDRTAAIRLVHLSDFHASSVVSPEFIAEAVRIAIAQRPDVVAITGDFFTNRLRDTAGYARILRALPEAAPTFACLGNHDGGPWTESAGGYPTIHEVSALLRDAKIDCLLNDTRSLTVRDRALQFIGVGDLWCAMCDPATAFGRAPPRHGATRILLNHNPDAKELLRPFDWDLMLCGHTHGGQIRLPLLGTPFAPVRDKRYVEGLHRWQDRWLHVTRGVGNLHGVRFNCRPQISVIEIL